jgi:hypothetical protein
MKALVAAFCLASGLANASAPEAGDVLRRMMALDPWGLAGAESTAQIWLQAPGRPRRALTVNLVSRRTETGLGKVLLRFSGPPELAGAGLLLVQAPGDDERFLFLPEQKRARRIPHGSRGESFLGTDFTFGDLDRHDLREAAASLEGEEALGDVSCYRLRLVPKGPPYGRVLLWVSEDTFLPLRVEMYDGAGQVLKTFVAEEVRRVSQHWYVTRSRMTNVRTGHVTEWVVDRIAPRDDVPDGLFTVRELEKR